MREISTLNNICGEKEYVCMCVYVCVCMYISMYMYIHICMYIYSI
jgi:hypothetical protein